MGPDSNLHPNPIRRFREYLRLSREAFCALIETNVQTLRCWERVESVVIPRPENIEPLLQLAKRNRYKLTEYEVIEWATEQRALQRRRELERKKSRAKKKKPRKG